MNKSVALAALFAAVAAQAQEVHKCTVNGAVTYQSTPCPAGDVVLPSVATPSDQEMRQARVDQNRQRYQAATGQYQRPIVVPPPPPPPVVVPAAPVSEKVTFAADAFFDFNKATLKPEGKAKLDDLVSKMGGIALEVIIAVGHTDAVGGDAYNQKLSVARSESVKAYLVSKGVEKNRVYTEGKGKKQPVADNKTAEGRAKNRRVEIEVVGTTK